MTIEVKVIKKPDLREPVVVCGLPGSGYVGKLAVDHLIKELKSELMAEVYSNTFPPHVIIRKDGTIDLLKNELYYWKNNSSKHDLILYTGDSQPTSSEGDYELGEKILELTQGVGANEIITLGAYITGNFTDKPKVYASATELDLVTELEKHGVIITNDGTITGMNGLILGLAKVRKMKGICLLGETSGYVVDAKASQTVLEVLTKILQLSISMTTLEERAKDAEGVIRAVSENQRRMAEKGAERGKVGYIS